MKKNPPYANISKITKICSDCGNCLYSCPVYNVKLREPNSPRGKVNLIKSIMDDRLKLNKLNKRFIYQCILCGSCEYICTNGVEFVKMMINYRNYISKGEKIPLLKKIILVLYQSFILKKLMIFVDILAKTPLKRYLLIPERKTLKQKKFFFNKRYQKQYDILLFPGCVLNFFYPYFIEKIEVFLKKKGFSVFIPKNLKCCGFPYISQGWKVKFNSFREKNIRSFSQFKFKYLVVPCSTGVITFKNFYSLNGIEIYELTEFIYKFLKDSSVNLNLIDGKNRKVTYHDPCHNLKSLEIEEEPRYFLKQYKENFVDDKSALCCGFGGVFSVGFPLTSKEILKKKRENLNEIGADIVVTSCPGCYLQLREKLPYDVKFFIELF